MVPTRLCGIFRKKSPGVWQLALLIAGKYSGLDPYQKEFLDIILPISRIVQMQVIAKCADREIPLETKYGVFASIIAALCIHRSKWGTHPVAAPKFKRDGKNSQKANNLALINADTSWKHHRQVIMYHGTIYRSYRDHSDFIVDISDLLSWKYDYGSVLKENTVSKQVKAMASRSDRPYHFQSIILDIIRELGLERYDFR